MSVIPRVIAMMSKAVVSRSASHGSPTFWRTATSAGWITSTTLFSRASFGSRSSSASEKARQARSTKLVGDTRIGHRGQGYTAIGLGNRTPDIGQQFGSLAMDKGDRDRVLVRKILVERTDAEARPFGNRIGRVTFEPTLLENASRRFDDDLHSRGRTRLNRLFSGT